jgi:hypothetical protein
MVLNEIAIRQGRYAPGKLISPKSEVLFWTPVTKDKQGNQTAELPLENVAEIRFTKPAASSNFHVVIRGALGADGVGDEWTVVVPTERMGILYMPVGFTTEQSIMGAVYRLPQPRNARLLADQISGMPGLTFTVQLL